MVLMLALNTASCLINSKVIDPSLHVGYTFFGDSSYEH
jgi:hypothetical protein